MKRFDVREFLTNVLTVVCILSFIVVVVALVVSAWNIGVGTRILRVAILVLLVSFAVIGAISESRNQ